jgi:hypothetical protein
MKRLRIQFVPDSQILAASIICIKWGRLLREVIPVYFENNTKVVKTLEEMRRISMLQGWYK